MLSSHKIEDFPANFLWRKFALLILLVEIFSLILVAEFSALKFLFILQKIFFQLLVLIN